jgi:hypothetical protein
MADLIAFVAEFIATIVFETVAWLAELLFWPARRKETSAAREPRALPDGRAALIVAALRAGNDAAAVLPDGWRGFHSSILDEPSATEDKTPVGAELRLVWEGERIVVESVGRSMVRLGYLTNGELERSIKLGRVRCWLASRKQTLTNPAAAVLFIAVYDP